MIPACKIDIFCREEDRALFETIAEDQRLSSSVFNITIGEISNAVDVYQERGVPDIVILSVVRGTDDVFQYLDILADYCEPGTKIILYGAVNDIGIYRELLAVGVHDYLTLPLDGSAILGCISRIFVKDRSRSSGKIVAIFGARGGVGTSTVAQNLAWAVSQSEKMTTILCDLDMAFGTGKLALDIDSDQDINSVLAQPERLDEALLSTLLVNVNDRLRLLGNTPNLSNTAMKEPAAVPPLFESLKKLALATVLDLPHEWSESVRQILLAADTVVIVTTPDLANMSSTNNLLIWLRGRRSGDTVSVVLNKLGAPKRKEVTVNDFKKAMDISALTTIDYSVALFSSAFETGKPIIAINPNHNIARCYRSLAAELWPQTRTQQKKKSLFLSLLEKVSKK